MLHQRHVIRHAVRDVLDGATAAEERVSTTRVLPYRRSELPAISVYTLEEAVDLEETTTSAPRELTRELQLEIAGWVEPGGSVDDSMDALALEIETAMHADPYLGDTVAECLLVGTTMSLLDEGEKLLGLVTLTYAVTYRTLAPEANEELDDFLVADVTTNLANEVHEDNAARDEVVVQELPDES